MFKVGDKVICTSPDFENDLKQGQQYEISEVKAQDEIVHVVGHRKGFYAHRFVLIESPRRSLGDIWGEERWGK